VCALTPFGLTGPARDFRTTAFISYAMSGCAHRAGPATGPPLMVPGQQQWDEASIHAAVAVMAALRVRDRGEGGQLIDLAVHEVGAAKDFLVERYDVEAMGAWGRAVHVGIPPTGRWECADGILDIGAHQRHHWDAFLEMAGHPEELSEPALADAVLRRELHDGLAEVVAGVMAARTRAEAFSAGQRAGLPCSPLNTPAEFVADDQPRARGIFQLTEKEGVGAFAAPWRWVHSAPELISLRRPAPTLGQHNREVYGEELGHDEAELAAWRENGLV
jgi:crotonobetainyl-CoA:carnitine CoA-transferase CaiB-like acyl-CoA transferase